MFELKNLYRWCDAYGGGIVVANSVEEATEKLINRYSRYGSERNSFIIWSLVDDDYFDPDHPDVFDIYE